MSIKIQKIARQAKIASTELSVLPTNKKNKILYDLAHLLWKKQEDIISENQKDVSRAKRKGLSGALIDRLMLNEKRIKAMCEALKDVACLKDPVGEVLEKRQRNGLEIKRVRIPLGVIGMIYESRPNVTVDAAGLCLKSGNAIVLRGGSEAFLSNRVLVKIISQVLKKHHVNPAAVSMVPDTDRKSMIALMQLDCDIDLLIPRGGEELMRFVKKHSKIPVIRHDKGVCSIFVDDSAKINGAISVIVNAKTQRLGVCNALESLYVHKKISSLFFKKLIPELVSRGVELRGDAKIKKEFPFVKKAKEEDFRTEYLDLILSMKIVKDVDDAIQNIRRYSSHHTESILTESKSNAEKFVKSLDSSCVMVNTSTRFNDGGELGLGAEIGISTTKLHAYGPMGLAELTTSRFVVKSRYKVRR